MHAFGNSVLDLQSGARLPPPIASFGCKGVPSRHTELRVGGSEHNFPTSRTAARLRSMYVRTYVHIYVYIRYIHAFICIYTCTHILENIHICLHIHIYVHIDMCIFS